MYMLVKEVLGRLREAGSNESGKSLVNKRLVQRKCFFRGPRLGLVWSTCGTQPDAAGTENRGDSKRDSNEKR